MGVEQILILDEKGDYNMKKMKITMILTWKGDNNHDGNMKR